MKKKIFGGIAVLAIAVVAVVNVKLDQQSNSLSTVSLANLEALGCSNGDTCGYSNHGPTADRFWSNTVYCKNENNVGCSY
jgi:hypothetical protein